MFEKIKNKFLFAKENYNHIRYKLNYIALPVIAIVDFLLLVVIALLVGTLKQRAVVPCVCIFSIIVLSLLGLMIANMLVKKQEIKLETNKLKELFNLKLSNDMVTKYVLNSMRGEVGLEFKDEGVECSGSLFKYSDIEAGVLTSNYGYKANLIVAFKINQVESGLEQEGSVNHDSDVPTEFTLLLDYNMLCILNKYNINIINKDVLNFIAQNTELAVKQIMKYGKIQNNYMNMK